MADGTSVKLRCPTDDGKHRGKVEGFCRAIQVFDRRCGRLLWTDGDKFDNLEQILKGRALLAYERVIDRAFWTNQANRIDANWQRFTQAIMIELCDCQQNPRDVTYAHLNKFTIPDDQDPDNVKARYDDVTRYADMLPGADAVPTEQKKLEVYYNMYNSGYRNKFSSVPRNIADAQENLVSVTKYMKTLWSSERRSGIRADGKPLAKKKKPKDEDPESRPAKKGRKVPTHPHAQGKNWCRRKICRDEGAPPHENQNCWYNPNGHNFRGYPSYGGRGGRGHGGGRGGRGGRGRGRGGRGGRGPHGGGNNGNSNDNDGSTGENYHAGSANSGGGSVDASSRGNSSVAADQHHLDVLTCAPAPAPRPRRGDPRYNSDEETLFSDITRATLAGATALRG